MGSRCLGWEAIATDFLELLVALAGRGRGEVEEAIVGGLAAVVALVRPSALRNGSRFPTELTIKKKVTKVLPRLCDLLLEAVGWAGGLDGEIGDAGKQVLKRNI